MKHKPWYGYDMKTAAAVSFALLLFACAACDRHASPEPGDKAPTITLLEVRNEAWGDARRWVAVMELQNHAETNGLLQIVRTARGLVLVEWFRCARGERVKDTHWGLSGPQELRFMRLYPCDLEDSAAMFRHLEQNEDGSAVSTRFTLNPDYSEPRPWSARIARAIPALATDWRLSYSPGRHVEFATGATVQPGLGGPGTVTQPGIGGRPTKGH